MFEYCGGLHLSHKWQWVHDELLSAARACGLAESESRKTLASAERRVRESGKTKVPMVLADPQRSRPPPPPEASHSGVAPSDDPWMLAPESQNVTKPVIKVTHEVMSNATEAVTALRRTKTYTNAKQNSCS